MFDAFQEILEDLGHQGYCGAPFALDRRPYGALAVDMPKSDASPLLLGALLMQEIITGRPQQMDEDDLHTILETTACETRGNALIVYWPELKYVQS